MLHYLKLLKLKYKYYDKCKNFNYSNMGFISRYDFIKKFLQRMTLMSKLIESKLHLIQLKLKDLSI